MSRVGKVPIQVPSGISVTVSPRSVEVKGPKGALSVVIGAGVIVKQVEKEIIVSSISEHDKQVRANFGTTRALIQNMVTGVGTGWKRSLELTGVGFNAKVVDGSLVLNVGFSHEVVLPIPTTLTCSVNKSTIELESCDRELLGNFAARIRKVQPPEPYLGKGIRYSDEVVRRKAGKTGKK